MVTDLDPACTAARHGTLAAYQRNACRCPAARRAAYLYYKHARTGQPYRRRIDATGTRRRIQALYAIGHTGHTIAATTGLHPRQVQQLGSPGARRYVTPATADTVAAAYTQLATTAGTSPKTRQRAAAAGYLPPQWWVDDIDDPTVNPLAEPDPDLVDQVLVDQVLAGRADPTRLTRAERAAAVAVAARAGIPGAAVANLLHISYTTYSRLARATAA